jgi:DNA invertase Pin-like site-specific DNA recombinase
MIAAIYARVSTDDGRQDAENQLQQLRTFCSRCQWTLGAEYVDHVSGKSDKRPEFQRMFNASTRREFDILLFWSLDRFSREGTLATLKHLERLTASGVGWKSFTEQYLDSLGPFSDAVLSILACIAKQERIRISERTRAGMDRAKRQGTHCGRPKRVFRMDRAVELRDQGLSWRAIGAELDVSFMTAKRLVEGVTKGPLEAA